MRRTVGLAIATGACVMTVTTTVARGPGTPGPGTPGPGSIDWPVPILGPGPATRAVLPFAGGLVGVGQEQDGVTTRAAAWWSAAGSPWERTLLDGPAGGSSEVARVVSLPTGLVA